MCDKFSPIADPSESPDASIPEHDLFIKILERAILDAARLSPPRYKPTKGYYITLSIIREARAWIYSAPKASILIPFTFAWLAQAADVCPIRIQRKTLLSLKMKIDNAYEVSRIDRRFLDEQIEKGYLGNME